jgi:hypothetical protein
MEGESGGGGEGVKGVNDGARRDVKREDVKT